MKYRIGALWNRYRTEVMPPTAPPIQVQEMRRAFYAGAECALFRLASEMSPGDSLEDPADENLVEEVQREFAEFLAAIKRGEA